MPSGPFTKWATIHPNITLCHGIVCGVCGVCGVWCVWCVCGVCGVLCGVVWCRVVRVVQMIQETACLSRRVPLIERQQRLLRETESVRDLTCSDRSLVSDKLVNQPLYEEKGKEANYPQSSTSQYPEVLTFSIVQALEDHHQKNAHA